MSKISLVSLLKEIENPLRSVPSRSGTQLADALAETGARYVELDNMDTIIDDIENDVDGVFIRDEIEQGLRDQQKSEDEIVYAIVDYLDYGNIATLKGDDMVIFYADYFYDMEHKEALETIRNAGSFGRLDEAQKGWDDDIDWRSRGTIAEELANTLADLGAGYYELTDEDLYEYNPEDWNSVNEVEWAADVLKQIGNKLDQYPLLYSTYKAEDGEFVFLFSDGTYLNAQDWTGDDIEMVIDAGSFGRLDEDATDSESWIETIIAQDLRYIEIPDSVIERIDGELEGDDTDDAYIFNEIGKILDKENQKAGIGSKYGDTAEEYDAGYFTIIDLEDFESLDPYWYDTSGTIMIYDDDYETLSKLLTPQEIQDIIDAGKFNLTENKDTIEPEEYDPEWEELEELFKDTVQELVDEITNSIDGYHDSEPEKATYEGADGFELTTYRISNSDAYMPTQEAQDKFDNVYQEREEETHPYVIEELGKNDNQDVREIFTLFGGDPETMTLQSLYDAEKAYEEGGDQQTADKFENTIDQYYEIFDSIMMDSDYSNLFYDVQLIFYPLGHSETLLSQPTVRISTSVSDGYASYDYKEFDLPFNSLGDLEEELPKLAKEAEDHIDGTTRRNEYKKEKGITEDLDDNEANRVLENIEPRFLDWADKFSKYYDDNQGLYVVTMGYRIANQTYIDLADYLNGTYTLPDSLEGEAERAMDGMSMSATNELADNLKDYFGNDVAAELYGNENEILNNLDMLRDSGDPRLEDLADEIQNEINDKVGEYMDQTGVMNNISYVINQDEDYLTITATVEVDPEYGGDADSYITKVYYNELDQFEKKLDQAFEWMTGQ